MTVGSTQTLWWKHQTYYLRTCQKSSIPGLQGGPETTMYTKVFCRACSQAEGETTTTMTAGYPFLAWRLNLRQHKLYIKMFCRSCSQAEGETTSTMTRASPQTLYWTHQKCYALTCCKSSIRSCRLNLRQHKLWIKMFSRACSQAEGEKASTMTVGSTQACFWKRQTR